MKIDLLLKTTLWLSGIAILLIVIPQLRPSRQNPLATNGRIAFVSDRDGGQELYTMRSDGTDVQRLTFNNIDASYPDWSPDASRIAFESHVNWTGDIYLIDSDGLNLINLTMTPDQSEQTRVWSPDGDKIAFSMRTRNGADIYLINVDSTGLIKIIDGGDHTYNLYPTWSPDGATIAFVSTDELLPGGQIGGYFLLKIMGPLSGRQLDVRVIEEYGSPDWSWFQNKISYYSLGLSYTAIEIVNADGSQRIVLSNETYPGQASPYPRYDKNPSWSPDGTLIVFDSTVYSDTDPNYFDKD